MCLDHKTTLKKTRIKLYNTLALPVLLYGSKTWTIKARDAFFTMWLHAFGIPDGSQFVL